MKKEIYRFSLCALSIIGLIVIESLALWRGINGVRLSMAIGAITLSLGYGLGVINTKRKGRKNHE